MTHYMLTGFQALVEEIRSFSVENIAARLYAMCGSCRYLQEYPYLDMISIAYLVDATRYKAIFVEWTNLILQDMDATCTLIRDMRGIVNIIFQCMDTENILSHYTIFDMWLRYTHNKDSWYSFRNRALITSIPTPNSKYHLPDCYNELYRDSEYEKTFSFNDGMMTSRRKSSFKPMMGIRSNIDIIAKRREGGFKLGEMPYTSAVAQGCVAHSFNQPLSMTDSIKSVTPAVCHSQINRVRPGEMSREDIQVRHRNSTSEFKINTPIDLSKDNMFDSQNSSSKREFTDYKPEVSVARLLMMMLAEDIRKRGRTVREMDTYLYVEALSDAQSQSMSSTNTQS